MDDLQLLLEIEAIEEREREKEKEKKARENYSAYAGQYIKIVNKDGEQVLFVHNEIQDKINKTVEEMRTQRRPVRIIILKARQEGVSTNEQGRMIFNTTNKKNRTGLIVAHESGATSKIFSKAKYMYDNLPDKLKPLQKASNAKELIFDKPSDYKGTEEGLNSKISVQVAGSVGIGRGDTIFYAHLSEFAFWPSPEGKSKKTQLAGILQAVPKTPETEVVIESTANGYDEFKELWDDAVAGKNEWIPLFFAWHSYKDYRMPVTEEERIEIMSNLTEYEQNIVDIYGLTSEQIKWYRWTLKNDCNGDINMMRQENPSFPDEAFISTGSHIFNIEKINQHKAKLEKYYKSNPPLQGEFIITWNNSDMMDYPVAYKWSNKPTGCIKIYEDVKQGYPYVIGGDTKGEGSDRFAGTVKNNHTGARCASLHWPGAKSKYYTAQMWALGMYFNTALIAIETNWNTYPVELLTDWHYPRQYQRETKDKFTGELKKSYGWRTDGNTRPLIIEKEITEVEENIENFTDIETLNEMLTFVDKDGRADAQSGKHDDLLISDMITNDVGNQQTHVVIEEPEQKKEKLIDKLGLKDTVQKFKNW